MDAEINWERELIMSKYPHTPARNDLLRRETDKVIRITITSNGTNQHHVPTNVMLCENHQLLFFPKMQNLTWAL